MSLFLLLLLPFAGSAVAALLPTNARNLESVWAAAVALGVAVPLALMFPQVAAGQVLTEQVAWLPSLGMNLSVRIDGFAWMFAMLVSGMGLLVIVYARYYLSPEDPAARFYSLLLGFMGAMLGVVLSGNLVQLVVFWELTSVFSFLLIGYWTHRKDARRGARMAFTVTATGGLALLGGVLLLGHMAGSLEWQAVLASGPQVRAHPLYPLALVLILLGALTKSAQFPFHFWLPHAMAAPTPVSAYLHSATMVKAGVFLLARLWPVLSGTDAWFWVVGGAGLATLLLGAYAARNLNRWQDNMISMRCWRFTVRVTRPAVALGSWSCSLPSTCRSRRSERSPTVCVSCCSSAREPASCRSSCRSRPVCRPSPGRAPASPRSPRSCCVRAPRRAPPPARTATGRRTRSRPRRAAVPRGCGASPTSPARPRRASRPIRS